MKRLSAIGLTSVIGVFLLVSVGVYGQDTVNSSKKITPIVQVFGRAVFDFSENADKLYGFSFDRAHLGLSFDISPQWSARVIIDRGRPTTLSNISVLDSNGQALSVQNNYSEGAYYTMALKFASLEWKASENFRIQGGAVLQNHYITQEKFWGFRYVAETFQDRYFKTPSSDLGFIAYYKFLRNWSVDFALTNGEGFRTDQDGTGKIKLASGIDFKPSEKFQMRVYYDYKQSSDTLHTAEEQTISFFTGYKNEQKFRIGLDANYRINHQHYGSQDIFGISVFAAKKIFSKSELFVRYDQLFEGSENSSLLGWKNYSGPGKAIIAGVHFCPVKDVSLSLNYQGWLSDVEGVKNRHIVLMAFEYKL